MPFSKTVAPGNGNPSLSLTFPLNNCCVSWFFITEIVLFMVRNSKPVLALIVFKITPNFSSFAAIVMRFFEFEIVSSKTKVYFVFSSKIFNTLIISTLFKSNEMLFSFVSVEISTEYARAPENKKKQHSR